VTVLLDDHLLADWLDEVDDGLVDAVADEPVATTNLWYVRLCRSAAASRLGPLASWPDDERRALLASLYALPERVTVVPLRHLAWRVGELSAQRRGLSSLGAEAVAAAEHLAGRVLVSSRDDGPGIRGCCTDLGIPYGTVLR
jgi:hypothetical protein